MIRLKSLLFEDKPKSDKVRVLLVGDEFSQPKFSFMNRLLRQESVTGNKFIEPGADSESMMNTVRAEIGNGYDAVVVFCSGRNEQATLLNIIENFQLIIRFAKKLDIKCILCTIPSFEYINDKKKQVDEKFIKKINNVNDWLTSSANADIIDVNFLTDKRDYFTKSGNELNQEANSKILKNLSEILNSAKTDSAEPNELSTDDVITVGGNTFNVDDVQKKLKDRGVNVTKEKIRSGKVDDKILKLKLATDLTADTDKTNSKVSIPDDKRATTVEIINYLKSKGLSSAGAAGVAANLFVESAGTFSTTMQGDRGTSIGLAQWHNERWKGKNGLLDWAKQNNADPYSVNGQLDFLLWELQHYSSYNSLYNELKTIEDPEEAADLFCKKFERPSPNQATYDKRKQYAREFYDTKVPDSEKDDSVIDSAWGNLTNIVTGIVGAAATSAFGLPVGDIDSGKITGGGTGGDWGGSMLKALEVADVANKFIGKNIVSSQKRSKKTTDGGATSDHYVGNADTYAVDLATGSPTKENLANGDKLLAHIMQWFGHPEYTGGKWFNVNKDGYRYQFGWRTPDGDHNNHIHVGVKKL